MQESVDSCDVSLNEVLAIGKMQTLYGGNEVKVELHLPSKDRDGIPLGEWYPAYQQRIYADVIKAFGGLTLTKGQGMWQGSHSMITEDVTIVTVYTDEAALEWFYGIAHNIAITCGQESVLYAIDGEAHFVEGRIME